MEIMKIKTLVIILLLSQSLSAKLIINEVLSNEPASSTTLEWIELYNDSNSSVQLSEYTLVVDTNTILLPALFIEPNSYIIICKRLFSIANEPSFESYWGNDSKIWGDTDYELAIVEPIEVSFSILKNDTGTIQLLQQGNLVSFFKWEEKSEDGTSWERKFPDSAIILQSESFSKSTAGFMNSITLEKRDLAIEFVDIILDNFVPIYTFTISNRGLTSIEDGVLLIDQLQFELPYLMSDSSLIINVNLDTDQSSLYKQQTAIVYTMDDNRTSNDTLVFTTVSNQYPPLILSEFLANHDENRKIEWIEIYNRSDEEVDLVNWSVGDEIKAYPITIESFILLPNQYVVIVKSANDFIDEYPLFVGDFIVPLSGATLNNDNDAVRLVDNFNIMADILTYTDLYDDNYTMSRELFDIAYAWGRSSESKGTPGYENEIFQLSNVVDINLSSKYISPDGDGYEDNVTIEVVVTDSKNYTLKIYDVNGNMVISLYDEVAYISNSIEWDGRSDNDEKLPIGIYILYLSTDDGLSTKETIVIAR